MVARPMILEMGALNNVETGRCGFNRSDYIQIASVVPKQVDLPTRNYSPTYI
jgi:hypothetical protein